MEAASTNTASVIVPTAQTATPRQRRRCPWGRIILGIFGVVLVALGVASYFFLRDELPSSALQARHLSALGSQLSFTVEPGPSPLIRYPTTGPYDLRLGYVSLPGFIQRLRARGLKHHKAGPLLSQAGTGGRSWPLSSLP